MKLYEHNLLALIENHTDNETGELNEQSFNDAQGGLLDKQLAVGAYILNLNNDAELLKNHIDKLNLKLKSIEIKKERLKSYLSNSLKQSNNLSLDCKLKTFKINLSLERDKSVLIDDTIEFDKKYLIEQKPKVSKKLILDDLEKGINIQGASITIKDRLTIK
jgi:hypothetical protein